MIMGKVSLGADHLQALLTSHFLLKVGRSWCQSPLK